MDFGTLKNTFTQTYINSHLSGDEKGKVLYKGFLDVLKESETLKSSFLVYKNIENKTVNTEFEANEYLNENLSVLKNFRGENSLISECGKLSNLLDNNDITVDVKPNELHESLHTLITTPRKIDNIDKIHESKVKVINWLMLDKTPNQEDKTNVRENLDIKKFLNIATEKYNEKYSILSEEEKQIIKILREGGDDTKKTLLQSMIKETVSLVNIKLENIGDNIDLKSKLLETKDVVYGMVDYNVDTFSENIKKIYDIKSVFVD
jgi:hypothetical protein|tara:strand:- start:5047 stop:5835 length:789 start_codon:yes stop_codon:yes gene_type:complete